MVAFAANSLLCRLALGAEQIDAASFTTIRVIAGALTLILISFAQGARPSFGAANWRSALALFAYMVFFSFAYISLGAASGALILFGAVQLTMFAAALGGESASRRWHGWVSPRRRRGSSIWLAPGCPRLIRWGRS